MTDKALEDMEATLTDFYGNPEFDEDKLLNVATSLIKELKRHREAVSFYREHIYGWRTSQILEEGNSILSGKNPAN